MPTLYHGYNEYSRNFCRKLNGEDGFVKFWTTKKIVAKTYGSIIEERQFKSTNTFTYQVGYDPIEYNEIVEITSKLEGALKESHRTGEDFHFYYYADYVIPAFCDAIIIENVVDVKDGCIEEDDEFSEAFNREMERYVSDIYMIFEKA